MNIFEAILLGIVQGLTEFLPVSSSGHLVLLQRIFGIQEPSLLFDTMLHAGTLLAVIVVLWKDIWQIIKKPIQKLTGLLIVATIPAVIAALTFKDVIEDLFISARFLGICFLITACLLTAAEILSKHAVKKYKPETNQEPEEQQTSHSGAKGMSWLNALFIGIMQAIAIPPGVSRSGAVISGALFCKIERDFAARFAFLMSIPAILGALVFQVRDLFRGSEVIVTEAGIGTAAIITGTVTAAVVGFFAVKFMLKIIREKSLLGFAVYTGALGIIIIFDQLVTRLVF